MCCFQVHWWRDSAAQGIAPSRDAKAPAIPRFKSGEAPFRMWSDKVIAIEHRKIEKIPRDQNAHGMQTHVLGTGAAEPVPVESGQRIAATGLEFSPENVGRHRLK